MNRYLIPVLTLFALLALPLGALGGEAAAKGDKDKIDRTEKADGDAVSVRQHVMIEERVIRLGDLFENVGQKADTAIAYAPEPGKQAVLDARWLYRVAKANGLNWQPLGASVYTIVERASSTVSYEDVKAQLLFALADQGTEKDMDIELATRFQQIYLPVGSVPSIRVEDMMYQQRNGRFSAVVAITTGQYGTQRIRLTGRAIRTVEVPVVDRRVLKDETIGKDDISWVKMNAERVQRDIVVNASDLIGMTPIRGLRAGMPVRSADVRRPVIVRKNSIVTIIHQVPNMTLTAQGKALTDGSEGDVIQIINARSNHVIEAEVIGAGRVAAHSTATDLAMTPTQ